MVGINRTVLSAAFMGLILTAAGAGAAPAEELTRTLSITGVGEISAVPDIASLSAGVRNQGKSAKEALTKNSESMSEVIKGMRDLGIAEKDIQTSNFSVQPLYERYDNRNSSQPQPPPKIVGYEVVNQVQVTIRDLSRVGEALDKFVSLGANDLHSVSFGFDDPKPLMDEARAEATRNAMKSARLIAQTSGAKLGKVLTIAEGSYSLPMPMTKAYAMRSEAADMAVPVATGENTVSAVVSIVFELN